MGRVLFTLVDNDGVTILRVLPEAGSKGIVWSEGLKLSIA